MGDYIPLAQRLSPSSPCDVRACIACNLMLRSPGTCSRAWVNLNMTRRSDREHLSSKTRDCAVHPPIAFCGELPPFQQLHAVAPPYLLPSQRETPGRLGAAEYGG